MAGPPALPPETHGGRRRLGGLRDVAVAALPVQAAFLWLYYYPRPRELMGDELRYMAEGLAIASGEGYAPTFVWPPLQSHLLGLLFWLFGPSLVAIQVLQIAALWGGGLVLRSIAAKAGLGSDASDLCLVTYVCYPELVAFSHYLWPEIAHLFFALCAARLAFEGTLRASLLAGGCLGVALLFKSLLLPFLPLYLAACAWPRCGRLRAGAGAAALLGLLGITGPVVLGNGLRHGYWGIAGSGAFNVWVGLNDTSRRNLKDEIVASEMERYLASSHDPRERERLAREEIRRMVSRDGIPAIVDRQLARQYHRLLDKDSFFTDQLPGGEAPTYAGLSALATFQLRLISYVLLALALVTGCFGMTLSLPPPLARALMPFRLFVLGNLAFFLVLHVKTRYRLPLYPAMFLYAAAFWDFLSGSREARYTPSRLILGLLVCAIALWLAFVPK